MFSGIDHFAILVNDLTAAMATYRALGFDVRAGGEHPAFGSHNALIALADGTYLELVGFKNLDLAATSFWREAVRRLRVGQGFDNFVLRSSDLAADLPPLRARGLVVSDAEAGARVRPDGQRVAFMIATIGETRSGLMPFLIQDETPRELRVEPAGEGLGARARVRQIMVAVNDPETAKVKYRALLDAEPRRVQSTIGDVQGYRFTMEWGSIVLGYPTRGNNALSEQLEQRGEGLHAVTLSVENFEVARRQLRAGGVKIEEDAGGFLILPDAACGARLRLVAN